MPGSHRMAPVCALAGVLLLAACAQPPGRFHDSAPIADLGLASCTWTGRYQPPVVYTESDFIRTFFEPADLAAYQQALPPNLSMPERPLIRVSVLHFYGMENGPVYHESDISVLAVHNGEPGWFVLKMPVTDGDACAGGRNALGTPKVMRRITLERGAQRYVGTSYNPGGVTPEFILTLDVGEPGPQAREVLRYVSPFSDIYLLRGQPVRVGGSRGSIADLETQAPGVWKIRLGTGTLEVPPDANGLLQRLGVGRPLASYWGQLRYRYSIIPRPTASASP